MTDPYKSIFLGVAALLGPVVTSAWPTVQLHVWRFYMTRESKKALLESRRIMEGAKERGANAEHLAVLEGELERAELLAMELQTSRLE